MFRARIATLAAVFPLALLVVSLAMALVGAASGPCPSPTGGGC